MTYTEKLQHPSWQRKRLEVFQTDGFICQVCGCGEDEGIPLNVHHKYYEKGKEIWDYPITALLTLCRDCHKKEEKAKIDFQDGINELMDAGFMYADLLEEIKHLKHTKRGR